MKAIIRRLLRRCGYDLFKHDARFNEVLCRVGLLDKFPGLTVLDVGANTGQFAKELRRAGFSGEIISFEPLSTAHEQLLRASAGDDRWRIAPHLPTPAPRPAYLHSSLATPTTQ